MNKHTPEAAIIRELMAAYDKYRQIWIDRHGTATGFDDWFRMQIMGSK